jgi:hypothetical protein
MGSVSSISFPIFSMSGLISFSMIRKQKKIANPMGGRIKAIWVFRKCGFGEEIWK